MYRVRSAATQHPQTGVYCRLHRESEAIGDPAAERSSQQQQGGRGEEEEAENHTEKGTIFKKEEG